MSVPQTLLAPVGSMFQSLVRTELPTALAPHGRRSLRRALAVGRPSHGPPAPELLMVAVDTLDHFFTDGAKCRWFSVELELATGKLPPLMSLGTDNPAMMVLSTDRLAIDGSR